MARSSLTWRTPSPFLLRAQIMSPHPVLLKVGTSCKEAARALLANDCSSAAVVSERALASSAEWAEETPAALSGAPPQEALSPASLVRPSQASA